MTSLLELPAIGERVHRLTVDEYHHAGEVPEYWLVLPQGRSVDVYREPTPEGYRSKMTLSDQDSLHCRSLPSVVVPVAEILPAPGPTPAVH